MEIASTLFFGGAGDDYSKVFKIDQLGSDLESASEVVERCDEVALRRLLASTELVAVISTRIPSWKRKELALFVLGSFAKHLVVVDAEKEMLSSD